MSDDDWMTDDQRVFWTAMRSLRKADPSWPGYVSTDGEYVDAHFDEQAVATFCQAFREADR